MFARNCGAKHPETTTGTRLQKHVATIVQLLNLKPNELESVMQYMGQNPNVHMNHYRLQESTMQFKNEQTSLRNGKSENETPSK